MNQGLLVRNSRRGALMIEVLVALSVIAGSLTVVLGAAALILRLSTLNLETVRVGYALEEGAEIVRFIRDEDWATFAAYAIDTPYAIVAHNGSWWLSSTTTESLFSGGTREIVFESVYRDANDSIVPSGSFDTDSRSVVVTVSLPVGATTVTRSARTYLSNIHE